MNISPVPVAIMAAGGLMLYSGISNRNPIDVVKLALSNGDITKAKPLMTGGIGGAASGIANVVTGGVSGRAQAGDAAGQAVVKGALAPYGGNGAPGAIIGGVAGDIAQFFPKGNGGH